MRTRTLFIAELSGHLLGRLAARHPERARAALEALEALGFRGAGWALLALDLRVGGRS